MKKMIISSLASLLIISSTAFALDATIMKKCFVPEGFVPEEDGVEVCADFSPSDSKALVKAKEAEAKAKEVEVKVDTFEKRIDSVNARTTGIIGALVNQGSCLYDATFPCTEDNLTHTYQTWLQVTPGDYTWTVPVGVTEIVVVVWGGSGAGSFVYGNLYGCYRGSDGIGSSFGFGDFLLVAKGGKRANCGVGDDDHSFGIGLPGSSGEAKSGYFKVQTGQNFPIVVGSGGTRNKPSRSRGGNGGVSIKYLDPLAP